MGTRATSAADAAAPRRRRTRGLVVVALAAGVAAPTGWAVTDRLERDNDFCNACHTASGEPLHAAIRRDFDAAVPASLAGAHAAAGAGGSAEGTRRAFRCIDCHGGDGLPGRLRVKVLAAKDAFWYAVGHFEEPEEMRWPLWDEDCRKCHRSFSADEAPAWQSPRFHALSVHNVDLPVRCVECHLVHETGTDSAAHFVHAARVRSQCARCHAEYEEGRE